MSRHDCLAGKRHIRAPDADTSEELLVPVNPAHRDLEALGDLVRGEVGEAHANSVLSAVDSGMSALPTNRGSCRLLSTVGQSDTTTRGQRFSGASRGQGMIVIERIGPRVGPPIRERKRLTVIVQRLPMTTRTGKPDTLSATREY